jgi:hypothetical protein
MKQKQTWVDTYLGRYKWYRKLRKGYWYQHKFTIDAEQLTFQQDNTFWARYGEINRYSIVIKQEIINL